METLMKIQCWNSGNEFSGSLSNDDLGWHSYCKACDSSFDVDVDEHLVPKGTKVLFHNGRYGVIDGTDAEDTKEFENINYFVCPVEHTHYKNWSDHYVMLLRDEFVIADDSV